MRNREVIRLTSKEATDYFNISTDTLRFYERRGVIPPVPRDKKGYRIYTDEEMNWLYLALSLKRAGLSLEKIAKFTQLIMAQEDTQLAQKELLREQIDEIDKELLELKETRELLQWKLDNFDEYLGRINLNGLGEDRKEWKKFKK